ncbi:MAG: TrmH family RNA methyltransferase [Pirellulales bacterium]|nr:TrmH family RNA methyltransferase [Pirellulales bacterium]
MITSLQNPRVKAAIRLRDSRQRRKSGRFLIDGAREILRAWQSGITLTELYYCQEWVHTSEGSDLLFIIQQGSFPANSPEELSAHPGTESVFPELLPVSSKVFERLAYGERAEGFLAVAQAPVRKLENFLHLPNTQPPLYGVLVDVEKPGNVGAAMRSADGAGVTGVIVAGENAELWNPNTIRASLGTIFHVPCCTATEQNALSWLRRNVAVIYAASLDAEQSYTEVDFTIPCAIALGSEDEGLDIAWQGFPNPSAPQNADDSSPSAMIVPIALPMLGIADSLNVSAAAAVLFYEALRQRGVREERG